MRKITITRFITIYNKGVIRPGDGNLNQEIAQLVFEEGRNRTSVVKVEGNGHEAQN